MTREASFLDESPLIIERIGEVRRDALEQAGITTIAEMLRRGVRRVADSLPGVSREQVGSWFAAASLLRVDKLDPQLADVFVNDGIRTVDAVADANLERLERLVTAAHERRDIPEALSVYALAAIQREAARLRRTGMLTGAVANAEGGQPLAGVTVRGDGISTETDARGRFSLHAVPEGRRRLHFRAPGGARVSVRVLITPDAIHAPLLLKLKIAAEQRPPREAHESDGRYVALRRGTITRLAQRTLDQLPDDTYLLVGDPQRDGTVRLVHLYRARNGRDVVTEVVSAAPGSLPAGGSKGQILRLQDGALVPTPLTLQDVAKRKFEAFIRRPLLVTARRRRRTVAGGGAT